MQQMIGNETISNLMGSTKKKMFILALRNNQQDLDPALLRRLEPRVIVILQDKSTKKIIFKGFILETKSKELNYSDIVLINRKYNVSDLKLVCK